MSVQDTPREQRVPGSLQDPLGNVFERSGIDCRRVGPAAAASYDRLASSGHPGWLVRKGWTVDDGGIDPEPRTCRVPGPERIPMLSWPHEWPFGALRAAAFLTLDAPVAALEHDLALGGASARNVPFRGAKPVFTDALAARESLVGDSVSQCPEKDTVRDLGSNAGRMLDAALWTRLLVEERAETPGISRSLRRRSPRAETAS